MENIAVQDERYDKIYKATKILKKIDIPFIARWEAKVMTPLVKLIKEKRCKKILFVGCGYGSEIHHFLELIDFPIQVYGIDISSEGINIAKKLINKKKRKVKFIVADGKNIPFKNNFFEVVIIKDSLHHIENFEECLREVARVSKKIVYILEPNRYNLEMILVNLFFYKYEKEVFRMDKEKIKKILRDRNFKIIDEKMFEFFPRSSFVKMASSIGLIHNFYKNLPLTLLEKIESIEERLEKTKLINSFASRFLIIAEKN